MNWFRRAFGIDLGEVVIQIGTTILAITIVQQVLASMGSADDLERLRRLSRIYRLIPPLGWSVSFGVFVLRRHWRLRHPAPESTIGNTNRDQLAEMADWPR